MLMLDPTRWESCILISVWCSQSCGISLRLAQRYKLAIALLNSGLRSNGSSNDHSMIRCLGAKHATTILDRFLDLFSNRTEYMLRLCPSILSNAPSKPMSLEETRFARG